jgi:ATP-dependent Clp protease adaptor protein ClpS
MTTYMNTHMNTENEPKPQPAQSPESPGVAVEDAPLAPPKPKSKRKPPKRQPPYHVIIWNDEEHSYEYVIELLMKLFAHPYETAFDITRLVDQVGKGIAYTCHMELAELKRDQILAYGADWRMPKVSHCSIRATIEPAPD